jgi:hypothetical protein
LIPDEKEARWMYAWQHQAEGIYYSQVSMYEDPEPMKTKWNNLKSFLFSFL